jgi:hypothetical protein
MEKLPIIIIAAVIILAGTGYWVLQPIAQKSAIENAKQNIISVAKNSAYIIGGEKIMLADGKSEKEITLGSASKILTQYLGNEIIVDFNGDGIKDIAFFMTQSSGGSGTFYYAAALVSSGRDFVGTNAVLLGDRVTPQAIESAGKEIIVKYADRKPGEAMTDIPTVLVAKYFMIGNTSLVEVEK